MLQGKVIHNYSIKSCIVKLGLYLGYYNYTVSKKMLNIFQFKQQCDLTNELQ